MPELQVRTVENYGSDWFVLYLTLLFMYKQELTGLEWAMVTLPTLGSSNAAKI